MWKYCAGSSDETDTLTTWIAVEEIYLESRQLWNVARQEEKVINIDGCQALIGGKILQRGNCCSFNINSLGNKRGWRKMTYLLKMLTLGS